MIILLINYYIHTHTHTHTHIHTYIHTYIHTCVHVHTHMHKLYNSKELHAFLELIIMLQRLLHGCDNVVTKSEDVLYRNFNTCFRETKGMKMSAWP